VSPDGAVRVEDAGENSRSVRRSAAATKIDWGTWSRGAYAAIRDALDKGFIGEGQEGAGGLYGTVSVGAYKFDPYDGPHRGGRSDLATPEPEPRPNVRTHRPQARARGSRRVTEPRPAGSAGAAERAAPRAPRRHDRRTRAGTR
jgi:hypothetical protein